ncbi:MAG TPA: hypothetical protein VKD72_12445 [Gemmataceae bacterium]|nr:hypothetical protein [Gemmataceae bacterium]
MCDTSNSPLAPVRQALVRHPVDPALDGLDLDDLVLDVGRHAANR